jgi:hypothetical protein
MSQDAVTQRNALIKQALDLAPRTRGVDSKPVGLGSTEEATRDVSGKEGFKINAESAAKMIDGVHIELYDFFNLGVNTTTPKTQRRMQYIMDWAMKTEPSLDSAMRRLNGLMIRLGNWSTGETKLDMVYNWMRLNGKP